MPTSREIIPNRPLSGSELLEIMVKDFRNMLETDGMFAAHIGFRRAAYSVSFKLMVDNPLYPNHAGARESRDPARNIKPEDPKSKIFAPPLTEPSHEAVVNGVERTREIVSPNAARLEANMPVTVQTINKANGNVENRQIQYDSAGVPPSKVTDTNISAAVNEDWGKLIPVPVPVVVVEEVMAVPVKAETVTVTVPSQSTPAPNPTPTTKPTPAAKR